MQPYWNLYVIIVGGLLAFSSLRKQPAAITTALMCHLFGLFAYENLDAMKDTTGNASPHSKRSNNLILAQPPLLPRGKCVTCSSRLLRPPLSEECKPRTSSATCLPLPHFGRWNCGGED